MEENTSETMSEHLFRNLAETAAGMDSDDFEDRFIAEYVQLKYRIDKLRKTTAAIRATECYEYVNLPKIKHDCPLTMLENQLHHMEKYLEIMEQRAYCEGIMLPKVAV